MKRFSLDKREN